MNTSRTPEQVKSYSRFLLFVAGLGGLLYGVDVGIIAGALPFLQDTAKYLDAYKLSQVVAAVLFGTVLSSLFAGLLSDIFGRKKIVILSAFLFALSIPIICLSDSFTNLMIGRILQGISGGLIGVVVPLYLAESLGASARGKGTGMFQFLLTVGLLFAAVIAIYFTNHVNSVMANPDATESLIFDAKDQAWRGIFWVSIIPGLILFFCAFFVSESPRWLYRKGRKEECLAVLYRGNLKEEADKTFAELEETAHADSQKSKQSDAPSDSIFQAKYIYPFVLAVIILACTQATGVNSVLNYSVSIFRQGGLEGVAANFGDTTLKVVNCCMTIVAMMLVDRKGRKFLLKLGTSGICIGLCLIALLFLSIENTRTNVTDSVKGLIDSAKQELKVDLINNEAQQLLGLDTAEGANNNKQIVLAYKQGSNFKSEVIDLQPQKVGNALVNPKINIEQLVLPPKAAGEEGEIAQIEIIRADLGEKPTPITGWLIVVAFMIFMASFAVGPGVCVWLALSELMPNRIRSNGMSIALLINQGVSMTIAGFFLPAVGLMGYSSVFFTLAAFTVVYFVTVTFFLPETKGKTLEEIEAYFASKSK